MLFHFRDWCIWDSRLCVVTTVRTHGQSQPGSARSFKRPILRASLDALNPYILDVPVVPICVCQPPSLTLKTLSYATIDQRSSSPLIPRPFNVVEKLVVVCLFSTHPITLRAKSGRGSLSCFFPQRDGMPVPDKSLACQREKDSCLALPHQ